MGLPPKPLSIVNGPILVLALASDQPVLLPDACQLLHIGLIFNARAVSHAVDELPLEDNVLSVHDESSLAVVDSIVPGPFVGDAHRRVVGLSVAIGLPFLPAPFISGPVRIGFLPNPIEKALLPAPFIDFVV